MATVRVLVLRAPGANCDAEAVYAFELAAAAADRVHINQVREQPVLLRQYQILVVPGGFSYGDDVAAGKILANQLRSFLGDEMQRFRDAGKLVLGICNGFQVLLKAGLLVPPTAPLQDGNGGGVPATLANNSSGKFEDRWIRMRATPGRCPFVQGYDSMEAPIAHGEGRFVCRDDSTLQKLEAAGQIVLRYVDADGASGPYPINPNGSQADIAGLCDASGQVLGLMPHPERHVTGTQHPQWTRHGIKSEGDGLRLFKNAVNYFQRW
jgi:phosphoribosylformylglycinamidine synthase